MMINPVYSKQRYISYKVEPSSLHFYKITINYFIDTGATMRDANIKRTKTFMCHIDKFAETEKRIKGNIEKTRVYLRSVLRKTGASAANIEFLMKQKMDDAQTR